MAAHAEARHSLCQTHRVVEGAPIGHQRRGGHDSASMSFGNGAIDARREAKVIGIDDQTAHRVSLAGERVDGGCRTVARISRVAEKVRRGKRSFRLTAFSPVAYTHPNAVRSDAPHLSSNRPSPWLMNATVSGRARQARGAVSSVG